MQHSMNKIITILCLACLSLTAQAADNDKFAQWGSHHPNNIQVRFNLGYAIGGTTPLPLPAQIRHIDKFMPWGGGNLGVTATKMFSQRWGMAGGLHGFIHGMKTGAQVKGYQMGIRMGEDEMSGYFTGTDETNVRIMGVTLPLLAVVRVSPRWTIEAGPFLQIFKSEEFEGSVYDGYLRVDTPTGEKVDISGGASATYDFSKDLRPTNWGLAVNFDWKATRRLSLYGALDWGMSGIFRHDFETIDFKMYSIYANVGIAYSIF